MPEHLSIPSLHESLCRRVPSVRVTQSLIAINVVVFLAMLGSGAGLWHSSNGVQLAWGANFGPATQDGEWWRLASAMFLHFGAFHLLMNMWALWDGGQLVERMYGPLRFAAIYIFCGISGNLLSLVSHRGEVVSGGASGAIFGIYGALLVCLWRERQRLDSGEFRWLFWGASAFSAVTIVLGFLIPGIDNAAHIGGFVAGLASGVVLARTLAPGKSFPLRPRVLAGACSALLLLLLIGLIPAPAYRWSDEALARQEISEFLKSDAAINRAWQEILIESKRGGATFDQLAERIDTTIGDRYEESFDQLSLIPLNRALPSSPTLEMLRQYAELRRNASRSLAEGLRSHDPQKIREAMALQKKSGKLQMPVPDSPDRAKR